jgi:GT2 family glycosyltransferase
MFKISIVILSFNSKKFIKPCLDSVFAQDYQDFEVIVVDNDSKDSTASFIKENYPQVILIENKQNFGACRARNQGIEVAQGEWILTLDCDIILEKSFLKKIMSFTEESKESVGIFQSKILKNDKKTIYSCGVYLSKLRRFYDIGKGKFDIGQFNTSKYIFGACSAAAFYKRQMLEEIKENTGYFDERFFFLVEDVDLAWRAQKRGWKALYYPEAVCYHSGNSSNTPRRIRQYLCFRNRYYSIIKNDSLKNNFINFFLLFAYDSLHFLYLLFVNSYTPKAIKEIFRFIKSEPKYHNSCK